MKFLALLLMLLHPVRLAPHDTDITAQYHDDVAFRFLACQYQIRFIDLGFETLVAVKWQCPWRGP